MKGRKPVDLLWVLSEAMLDGLKTTIGAGSMPNWKDTPKSQINQTIETTFGNQNGD